MLKHLVVVLADMLGIKSITSRHLRVAGKSGLLALQGDIAAAHKALAEVVEAVGDMPDCVIIKRLRFGGVDAGSSEDAEAGVGFSDGVLGIEGRSAIVLDAVRLKDCLQGSASDASRQL